MAADTLERPVTVAVIEDMDVVVEGVRGWIAEDPQRRATIVAEGDSIDAVLNGPGRDADVIVLDLELKDAVVIDRIGELCDAGHRVVIFSIHVKPLIVQAALAAGACAFLDKHTEGSQFVDAVVNARRDLPFVTRSMAGGLLQGAGLSPREREALLLLFQGMDHGSIARRMTRPDGQAISAHTVKQYIDRARAKFAAAGRPCRSTYALLASSIAEGLIRPEEIDDYRSSAAPPP